MFLSPIKVKRLGSLRSAIIIAFAGSWSYPLASGENLQLKLVSQDTLLQRLREGMVRNRDRKQAIAQLFEAAGCEVRMQPVDGSSANVICDSPGQTSNTIVVGGHLDFIDAGHGIVDDWSGASMLASLYETLKSQSTRHSFEFVAFAGEEKGLLGSNRYIKELKKTDHILPQAFVNLECLGMDAPKVWATRADPNLLRRLIEISNAMHISLQGISVDKVGDDDSHPFLTKKVPVITIHSLTQENLPVLHSSKDKLDAINPSHYYDAYRLAAFYLKYLDVQLASDVHTADR